MTASAQIHVILRRPLRAAVGVVMELFKQLLKECTMNKQDL